jgi:hypothetical protein
MVGGILQAPLAIVERNTDGVGERVSEKGLFEYGHSGREGPPAQGRADIRRYQDCRKVDATPAKCEGYLDSIDPRDDMVEKQAGLARKRILRQQFLAGREGVDAEALDFQRKLQRGAQSRIIDDRKHVSIR